MDTRLLISLALWQMSCCWARPQGLTGVDEAGLQETLSKLQLLNELTLGKQLVGEDFLETPKQSKKKPHSVGAPGGANIMHMTAPIVLPTEPSLAAAAPLRSRARYSDGPFSAIPADAFRLDHRKEFRLKDADRASVAKSEHAHKHAHAHEHEHRETIAAPADTSLMRTCLDFFRGRAHPERGSVELMLDICTELLDDTGVQQFALDDDRRQKMYDFRTDGDGRHRHREELALDDDERQAAHHHHSLGPGVSVPCDLCPRGHHVLQVPALGASDDDDDDGDDGDDVDDDDEDGDEREDVRSQAFLNDLLELFKPIGHRREWVVVNSKSPNKRMRTYVNLKK